MTPGRKVGKSRSSFARKHIPETTPLKTMVIDGKIFVYDSSCIQCREKFLNYFGLDKNNEARKQVLISHVKKMKSDMLP